MTDIRNMNCFRPKIRKILKLTPADRKKSAKEVHLSLDATFGKTKISNSWRDHPLKFGKKA